MQERISQALDDATRALAARLHRDGHRFAHPDPDLASDVIVRMVTGAL